MMLGSVRVRTLLVNVTLLVLAFSSGLIAVVREQFSVPDAMAMSMSSMAMADAVSVDLAHALVATKAGLAALVLVAVLAWMWCRCRRGTFLETVAASPLARSSIVVGTTIAVGLAAFDVCTRYHGAAMDSSGSCYCWTTGMLAAAASCIVGIVIVAGRAILTYCRNVVRVIVALVVRLCLSAASAVFRRRREGGCAPRRRQQSARRMAGRAPPTFA
jgi:hypothetical protein